MTPDEARRIVTEALADVAPEVDPDTLDPAEDLQRAADLDSMDMLTLIENVAGRVGIDIPDTDTDRLSTLDGLVAYLCERASSPA